MQQLVKYLAQISSEYMLSYKVNSDLLGASGREFDWLHSVEGTAVLKYAYVLGVTSPYNACCNFNLEHRRICHK